MTGSGDEDGGGADDDRRAALLLALLRLSRDPELLPRLEAARAGLDDGRRPQAARRSERRLLRGLGERVPETLSPEDARVWEAELRVEVEAAVAAAAAERHGLAPPSPGTPARVAGAMRAAGELVARLEAGGEAEVGAATSDGWTVVGRAGLERVAAWQPSDLWALLAPDEAELAFVATGGAAAPAVWDWAQVEAELEFRRAMLSFTEALVRAAARADPANRAEREAAREALRRAEAARRGAERRGAAGVLRLLDGRPMRAEGAVLLGPGGEELGSGFEARRLDGGGGGAFADEAPPARIWWDQVWARPLPGGGTWRRGRLRPEADRLAFLDEPEAEGPERGDGAPPGGEPSRNLEWDLLTCGGIRSRAARGAVYARLLYAALANSTWRHPASGAAWAGGRHSAAALVASVVGGGSTQFDWVWGGPHGVLDEEVLADLRALGWERVECP